MGARTEMLARSRDTRGSEKSSDIYASSVTPSEAVSGTSTRSRDLPVDRRLKYEQDGRRRRDDFYDEFKKGSYRDYEPPERAATKVAPVPRFDKPAAMRRDETDSLSLDKFDTNTVDRSKKSARSNDDRRPARSPREQPLIKQVYRTKLRDAESDSEPDSDTEYQSAFSSLASSVDSRSDVTRSTARRGPPRSSRRNAEDDSLVSCDTCFEDLPIRDSKHAHERYGSGPDSEVSYTTYRSSESGRRDKDKDDTRRDRDRDRDRDGRRRDDQGRGTRSERERLEYRSLRSPRDADDARSPTSPRDGPRSPGASSPRDGPQKRFQDLPVRLADRGGREEGRRR